MAIKVVNLSNVFSWNPIYRGYVYLAAIEEHGSRSPVQCCITTTDDLWDNGKTLFVTKEKFYCELLGLKMKDNYPHIKYYTSLGIQSEALRFINIIKPDVIIYNHDDDLARLLKADLLIPIFPIFGRGVYISERTNTKIIDEKECIYQDSFNINPLGENIKLDIHLCEEMNLDIKKCIRVLPYRRIKNHNIELAFGDNRFKDSERKIDNSVFDLYINYKIVEMISNTTLGSKISSSTINTSNEISDKNGKITLLIEQLESIKKELLKLMD